MLDDLKSQIRSIALENCVGSEYQERMLRALSRPGFALHPDSSCRTGILALETFRAAGGSPSAVGLQAATAVELQIEAAFMFDHVADHELNPEHGMNEAEELRQSWGMQGIHPWK